MLQTLPLQLTAWDWELPGCVWPHQGRASMACHPHPSPPRSLASPSRNLHHPLLFSLKLVTLAMETMMTVQSTLLLVTWGNAVAAIHKGLPTAVTSVNPRTSPCNGVPWRFPNTGAHPSQKDRGGLAGGPKDIHAPFLTRVSIKNSGMVSKFRGISNGKCWIIIPNMHKFRISIFVRMFKLQNFGR